MKELNDETMKSPIITILALIGAATVAMADPQGAITAHLKQLSDKVDADLAANAITKVDGDELHQQIDHVQHISDSEPVLTHKTHLDLARDIGKIEKSLAEKEAAVKATANASPTP